MTATGRRWRWGGAREAIEVVGDGCGGSGGSGGVSTGTLLPVTAAGGGSDTQSTCEPVMHFRSRLTHPTDISMSPSPILSMPASLLFLSLSLYHHYPSFPSEATAPCSLVSAPSLEPYPPTPPLFAFAHSRYFLPYPICPYPATHPPTLAHPLAHRPSRIPLTRKRIRHTRHMHTHTHTPR